MNSLNKSDSTPMPHGVPQESALGPLMFVLYTADVFSIASSHGVDAHGYADDIQLYTNYLTGDDDLAITRLVDCINEIEKWMCSTRLCLNMDKTKFMCLG